MNKCFFICCQDEMIKDRRISTIVIVIWLFVSFTAFFKAGGANDNSLIRFGFGPADDLKLLGITINTWSVWWAVVLFSCADTVINVWASEAISPWITNTIYDDKQMHLEYPKLESMIITNVFFLYKDLHDILTLYVYFTQIDILLIRIWVEFCITVFMTWRYIRPKHYVPSDIPPVVTEMAEMTETVYEPGSRQNRGRLMMKKLTLDSTSFEPAPLDPSDEQIPSAPELFEHESENGIRE